MTALIRNAHGIAARKLFLKESNRESGCQSSLSKNQLCRIMNVNDTITLFRPVGPKEFDESIVGEEVIAKFRRSPEP